MILGVKCPHCGSRRVQKNIFFLTESSDQYFCEKCDKGFNTEYVYRH